MTLEIAIVLILLVVAVALFATERLSVDLVTLIMLCVLMATRILTPREAFAGFSSDIIVILGSIFVLGAAVQRSGVLEGIAGWILKIAGGGEKRMTSVLMICAALISAFMNNTTVAAMFVPPATSLARRSGISASKLLMPLAFAAIMGGTCTLIGTSTNVAVSGYIAHAGMKPLGLFEIAPIGLAILVTGTLFMVFIGARMLPEHEDDAVTDAAEMRNYLAEFVVLPHSPLIGDSAVNWALSPIGFRLVQIIRSEAPVLPDSKTFIAAGDTLVIEGKVENLRKVLVIEGLEFNTKLDPGDIESLAGAPAEATVAEAIILPGSELCGSTLEDVQFRQHYGLTVLAVNRNGEPLVERRANVHLREGDVLLVHGPGKRVDALLRSGSRLQRLGDPVGKSPAQTFNRKGVITVGIFIAALIAGTTGWLPMAGAFLTAAVLVILSGCITVEKAHEFIDWRLLILVGGMTAFGAAMEKTGAAQLLAGWVVAGLSPMGTMAVLAGFFVLTIAFTQPMSNAAAALVVLPIALSAANTLGAEPRTFAIGVMLAASISFIAPLEPACVLVYGAGKYRFRDFLKVGGLLTLVLTVVVLILIPFLWKF